MRSVDLFLPSVADNLNLKFLDITHCALPYYTGSFHLYSWYNLGRGAHARARWLRNKNLIPGSAKVTQKVCFPYENIKYRKNIGTLLLCA